MFQRQVAWEMVTVTKQRMYVVKYGIATDQARMAVFHQSLKPSNVYFMQGHTMLEASEDHDYQVVMTALRDSL